MASVTKILIVEDERALCDMLVEVLESEGYAVVVARNGQQALDMLPREQPNLVLLDLMLPIVNGQEVLRRLRQWPRLRDTPVILMTAVPYQTVPVDAQDFVRKPFELDDMLARIGRAARRQRRA